MVLVKNLTSNKAAHGASLMCNSKILTFKDDASSGDEKEFKDRFHDNVLDHIDKKYAIARGTRMAG